MATYEITRYCTKEDYWNFSRKIRKILGVYMKDVHVHPIYNKTITDICGIRVNMVNDDDYVRNAITSVLNFGKSVA